MAKLPRLVALLEAWRTVFPLIRWVDTKEHDAPPYPDRQVPPFAGDSSQVSKTPPTPKSAACKKPGVDGKPPQKIVFKNLRGGQGEKIRWST